MRFMLLAALAALAACSPPASKGPSAPETPILAACNDVAPNLSQAVTLGDEIAVSAAVADLRGGRIAPGTYDLVRGNRIGGATGWQDARAVALNVSEDQAGTIFNWASAPSGGGDVERWSAGFIDAPSGHLTFTCGRSGGADIDFNAEANGLRLQLPDASGTGSLYLVFAKRG